MSDYTPTTEEISDWWAHKGGSTMSPYYASKLTKRMAEFSRWLAAHDAEVRASVLAEEPEWEYGISSGHGSVNYVGTRESVDARVRSFEKAGAPLRDGEQIFRRRKVGLWAPVKQEGADQ